MALSSQLSKKDSSRVIKRRRSFLSAELQREKKTLADIKNVKGSMVAAANLMVSFTIN